MAQPSPVAPRARRAARIALGVLAAVVLLVASGVRRDRPLASLMATYGAPPSRFAEVEGIRVHYRDEGSGPPIVLIHGTSSSLHTWDAWTRALAPHRRVIRLDLPGFGLTGPAPDRDYRAVRYARLVAHLLDRLGVERADVAGNSLGGRVALELALGHPERVRRLVLVDAAGLSGQVRPLVFRIARVPVLSSLMTYVTPRFLVRNNVEQVYGEPARITEELVDRYQALLLRAGNRQALVDRLSGPSDAVVDDRLAAIHVPTLILWGARDRWIPLSFAHRLERGIAGAELHVYDDAGHVPMEEQPEATVLDADAFLSRP